MRRGCERSKHVQRSDPPRERDAYFAGYLQARGRVSTHRRPSEYYEHGEDVRRALLEIQCPEEMAASAADHFQAGKVRTRGKSPAYRVQGQAAREVALRLRPFLSEEWQRRVDGVREKTALRGAA